MRKIEYKYIVGIVFVIGMFMDLLDITIVNVALPTLAQEFSATTTTIEWIVTAYLVSLAVFIPVSGWAGDRFGTKRVFMFALAVFTAGSLMCGLAWNIESLIGFRVLQGVGGGMLTPVGTTMLFRAFPPAERAKASALLAIPAVVAPASGPVLGGYLVEFHDWRWIFLINIPIGIAGLVVCALFLKEDVQESPGRLDIPGLLLSAGGLALTVYALAEAGAHGFDDGRVVALGLTGIALLLLLVVVELRTPEPMLDMRLFGNKLFAAANAVQMLAQGGMQGALFLLPIFLQAERGLSPFQTGLTTFPHAIGVVMMVQPAGRLYAHIGPRKMMMAGMAGISASTFALLAVDLETSQWWIRLIMLSRGWAFALTLIPLQTATFATISAEDTGRASAIFSSLRQVAASLGVALLATVLTTRLDAHDAQLYNPATRDGALLAFHDAFFVAGLLGVVGFFAAMLISDREAAGTMVRRMPGGAADRAAAAPH